MIGGAVLNPTSDGFPAQLDIHDAANGYQVLEPAEFPPPQPKPAYATSYDTEGSAAIEEAHYENRQISLKVRVYGTSSATLEAKLNALYKMVGQINREGGVLKVTTPNNTVCYFDLVPETMATATLDKMYQNKFWSIVDLQMMARPFWRGAEVSLGTVSETTLPALVGVWPQVASVTATSFASASSEYAERADETALDLGDTVTMEAWVKRASTGVLQTIMSKGAGAYNLRFSATNNLEFVKSTVAALVASTTTVTDTDWHHVAGTKTGATVKLYIDGVDRTGVVTNSTLADNSRSFKVGADDNGAVAQEFFNGSIYGAALYSTALSGARVASHASQTSETGYLTEQLADSPVLVWQLDEPSGTNADDSTANNRDGTYVNTPTFGAVGPIAAGTPAATDGDVPALGRLVVTDSTGADQWTVIVGGESRYYNSSTASTTSALFLQGEDLTPLGTSMDTAGAAGASGTNVIRNTDLTTTYQAILKSEIDSSNLALTHKGTFRVWARLYRPTGNVGAVTAKLEWGEGDYVRVTQNDPVAYVADDREGAFTWANLGVVSLNPDSTQWEFRLLAKSTVAGDEIDADCFQLFPTEITYAELSAKVRYQSPSSFSARSEFDTESGAITGDALPIGGTWTALGDADDYSVAAGVATRTAISDTSPGRIVYAGTPTLTTTTVRVDSKSSVLPSSFVRMGVAARVVDVNNFVAAWWDASGSLVSGAAGTGALLVAKIVAGSATNLLLTRVPVLADTYYATILQVDAAGRWYVWRTAQGATVGDPVASGQDSALATGGTLASGKVGVYDYWPNATASTRTYDNFAVWAPTPDAAIFASQSLTLGHDYATRENSGGTFSTTISERRGRYLKIPPAGPEGRSTRLVVKGFRNDPYTSPDGGIDDISAQLYVTPRGLVVPEA